MFNRVIVTGGTGFFGSRIAHAVRASGIAGQVFALGSREYDLRDESAVVRMFADLQPDAVIHAAGHVGGIGANRANPAGFFYDNLKMGSLLIHHAQCHAVRKLVLIGTVCSYPKHTPVPFCEDAFWTGYPEETNAPYGIAKLALFAQAEAYRTQHGLQASCVVPANLYGPGDTLDTQRAHVIPAMLCKFWTAKHTQAPFVELWGDGTPTRDFLYVDDAAHAVTLALARPAFAGPCNIGTGIETSIQSVAAMIAAQLQYHGDIRWNTSLPNGQQRRCLDVSRAKDVLSFSASVGLPEGMRRTVAWFVAQQALQHTARAAAGNVPDRQVEGTTQMV